MIRFFLIFVMSLAVSSQNAAAVEWNNSSDKEFICETENADTYFSGKNRISHKKNNIFFNPIPFKLYN